jgi:hypothetical protein
MGITIFALRFENGSWSDWEHTCDMEELEAVEDSARVKASDNGRSGGPIYIDFLEGARYIFDIAFGPRDNPKDGDIEVFGVLVDRIVIGRFEQMQRHFALKW